MGLWWTSQCESRGPNLELEWNILLVDGVGISSKQIFESVLQDDDGHTGVNWPWSTQV